MSLYAEYRKERGEAEIIEKENGFASYSIGGDECYIQDIYVRKAFRKTNLATQMANEIAEIAKQKHCKYLIGSVVSGTESDTRSLQVLLAYGMKLHGVSGNIIYMVKDL